MGEEVPAAKTPRGRSAGTEAEDRRILATQCARFVFCLQQGLRSSENPESDRPRKRVRVIANVAPDVGRPRRRVSFLARA